MCWGEGEQDEATVESSMLGDIVMLTMGGEGGLRFQRRYWREERWAGEGRGEEGVTSHDNQPESEFLSLARKEEARKTLQGALYIRTSLSRAETARTTCLPRAA